ncbi:hypothetical protein [Phormidium sp. CCY1219]|nr:hypothetical protein [Phormidium sp. CCY1219]MEB3828667.1 hypothetical protein [Phormidium sp. CCY1219]
MAKKFHPPLGLCLAKDIRGAFCQLRRSPPDYPFRHGTSEGGANGKN